MLAALGTIACWHVEKLSEHDAPADDDVIDGTDTESDGESDSDSNGCVDVFHPDEESGLCLPGDHPLVYWYGDKGIAHTSSTCTVDSQIEISIWESYGAPMIPDTESLSGDNAVWMMCWYCVLYRENAVYDENKLFVESADVLMLAYEGEIEITSIDPANGIQGMLSNVRFREVDTLASHEPIPDGLEHCIDHVSFSAHW